MKYNIHNASKVYRILIIFKEIERWSTCCVAIIIDLYFSEPSPSPAHNFICSLVDVTVFRVLCLLGPFLFFRYMLSLEDLLHIHS